MQFETKHFFVEENVHEIVGFNVLISKLTKLLPGTDLN